jgi:hypothetical protein
MNSVIIKKYSDNEGEGVANAAITPGMLIELISTGKYRAHATAAGNAMPIFAKEDALQGKGIDDVIAANDTFRYWIPVRGDEVNAILADDETVYEGDLLESHGDGTLRKLAMDFDSSAGVLTAPMQVVAIALEAMDTSASSKVESTGTLGSTRRIRVRIV